MVDLGRTRPRFGRVRPILVEVGGVLVHMAKTWPTAANCGRSPPKLGRMWPGLVRGTYRVALESGHAAGASPGVRPGGPGQHRRALGALSSSLARRPRRRIQGGGSRLGGMGLSRASALGGRGMTGVLSGSGPKLGGEGRSKECSRYGSQPFAYSTEFEGRLAVAARPPQHRLT